MSEFYRLSNTQRKVQEAVLPPSFPPIASLKEMTFNCSTDFRSLGCRPLQDCARPENPRKYKKIALNTLFRMIMQLLYESKGYKCCKRFLTCVKSMLSPGMEARPPSIMAAWEGMTPKVGRQLKSGWPSYRNLREQLSVSGLNTSK